MHVSDALKQLRLGGGCLSGWLGAAETSFTGTVLPVQCIWEDYRSVGSDEYRTEEIEAAVGERAVVVIDGSARPDAVFGAVAAAAYLARGARAVVVNGGVRDCSQSVRAGLAVLARHAVHRSGHGSVRRELTDRVIIDGVEIRSGDVVVGDERGIVVVPARAAGVIAERASTIAASDAGILGGLEAGLPFADVWSGSSRNTK